MADGAGLRRAVVVAVVAVMMGALVLSPGDGEAQDTIRVAFWSPVTLAEFAPFYMAEERGEFKKYGLKFEFVGGRGNAEAYQHVAANNAQIGVAGVEVIVYGAEKGSDVVAFYNYLPQNIFTITGRQSRGIRSVKDLKGKKLGVNSLAAGVRYNCQYVLERNGIAATDVEFIAVGINYLPPMEQGRLDGVCSWDTADYQLYNYLPKEIVADLKTFPIRDFINVPSDVLVARRPVLREKAEQITNFIKAYEVGLAWVKANPEAAAKAMEKYVAAKGQPGFFLESLKMRVASNVETWMTTRGLGTFDPAPITELAEAYHGWGLVKRKVLYNELVTNEILERLGRR